MLHRNVGGMDRTLRIVLGAILLAAGVCLLGLQQEGPWGVVFAVVGGLGLMTGLTRFCVLYVPFGISTARGVSSAPASRNPAALR